MRYLIITFACGLLLPGAPLAQAETSSPADVSPFRYIGARISCLAGAPPQIRYKADGVDYAPNRKIDIVLEIRLNNSLEPVQRGPRGPWMRAGRADPGAVDNGQRGIGCGTSDVAPPQVESSGLTIFDR